MKSNNFCVACRGKLRPWLSRPPYTYFQCSRCQTNKINPIPSEQIITAHYKKKFISGNYFLGRKFARQYLSVFRQFVSIIATSLATKNETIAQKSILDIGCFTGDFLGLMEQAGADVYGTELQKEAIEIANKKFPGRIFQGDIATTRFPKRKFSIVTLLGLIEHVTDPHALLTSVDKLIEPNGLLLIQTPNASSIVARIFGKWWPPLAPIEHIHIFSAAGLVHFLQSYGYTQITVKAHVKWLPIVYVYNQLANFGPHFYRLLSPFDGILQRIPARVVIPFYGGEMIVTAYKMN